MRERETEQVERRRYCFCVNITSNTQLRTGEVLQRGVEAVVEVNQADTMMPER